MMTEEQKNSLMESCSSAFISVHKGLRELTKAVDAYGSQIGVNVDSSHVSDVYLLFTLQVIAALSVSFDPERKEDISFCRKALFNDTVPFESIRNPMLELTQTNSEIDLNKDPFSVLEDPPIFRVLRALLSLGLRQPQLPVDCKSILSVIKQILQTVYCVGMLYCFCVGTTQTRTDQFDAYYKREIERFSDSIERTVDDYAKEIGETEKDPANG